MLGTDIVDWQSKKQSTVAISTCEAEYMAIGAAAQAIQWVRRALREIDDFGTTPTVSEEVESKEEGIMRDDDSDATTVPTTSTMTVPILLCDNKAAIALAKNDVQHNRTKHIDVKHHFIREQIISGDINLQWIDTKSQLADLLTKTLAPRPFAIIRDQLVVPRPTK
jgi:hypothetical protein